MSQIFIENTMTAVTEAATPFASIAPVHEVQRSNQGTRHCTNTDTHETRDRDYILTQGDSSDRTYTIETFLFALAPPTPPRGSPHSTRVVGQHQTLTQFFHNTDDAKVFTNIYISL